MLESIYEQDFLDCSYGFRPGRSAHDAVLTLDRVVHRGEVNWILEADIVSLFDSIDRKMLMEMLQVRVADKSLLRLVGQCLHVGVLDGEEVSSLDVGTAQGSALSPLLGNVYLHYVLDLWFDQEVKPYPGSALPYPGSPLPYPGSALPYPGSALPYPGSALPYPSGPFPRAYAHRYPTATPLRVFTPSPRSPCAFSPHPSRESPPNSRPGSTARRGHAVIVSWRRRGAGSHPWCTDSCGSGRDASKTYAW